jgi:hypothetical protein
MGHPGNQLLSDAELRGIDEIIGRVNPQHGGGNGAELRLRIVVTRGVDVTEKVVGGSGDDKQVICPAQALKAVTWERGF